MLFSFLQRKNTKYKCVLLSPHIQRVKTVLDFGCGDQALAHELWKKNRTLKITGIDVVDYGCRMKSIRFRIFNGKIIPFRDGTFDVTIAWHVFHHTPDPLAAFRECMRVSKYNVIFIEPVWRYRFELPGMAVMDRLFNVWKDKYVSLPCTFQSQPWWEEQIVKENGRLLSVIDVEILPWFFPTGRSKMFIVEKSIRRKRVVELDE